MFGSTPCAGLEGRGRRSLDHDYVTCSVPAAKVISGYCRNRLALLCCLSLLVHTIVMFAIARFGPMDFARPVMAGQIIDVDLKELKTSVTEPDPVPENHQKAPQPVTVASADGVSAPAVSELPSGSRQIADENNESLLAPVSHNIGSEVNDEIAE